MTQQINIRAALESRLLSLLPTLPTAWDNKPLNPAPAAAQPYQRAYLLPAENENPTLTETLQIEQGIFQVSLYFPLGAGSLEATQRARDIAAHFPPGLMLDAGTIRVRIRGGASVAAGLPIDDRYMVPVRMRYICIF